MSFGEKLAKLRKEKNMSQESLANELNVSRQAVSKWESNNAYPETEKIIALCKILNCSMDEMLCLANDSSNNESKKENNIFNCFNNFFNQTLKGIKLFFDMTFKQKAKCLFEMVMSTILIIILLCIIHTIIMYILKCLLSILPNEILWPVLRMFEGLLILTYLIIGIYTLIRLYKIRYLDCYIAYEQKIEIEPTNKKEINLKEEKIIIRDLNTEFNLLNCIKKVSTIIFKIISCILLLGLILAAIIFIACTIFLITLTNYGKIIIYFIILFISLLLGSYIMIELLFKYTFNIKQKFKHIFIILIITIVLFGTSCGLSATELSNYTIINDTEEETLIYKNTINMEDNLIIEEDYNIKYIFENRDDIYIEYYSNMDISIEDTLNSEKIYTHNNKYLEYTFYYYHINYSDISIKKEITQFLENIKNKEIITNNNDYIYIKIYISESNYLKLKQNENIYTNYLAY